MDVKNLTTFIQVAELSSFTRAAEKLGYSQPTISFQIKQLEQELGIRLFDRIGHTVRLTDQGRDVLAHAQQICHACEEMMAEGEQQKEARGVVRLAMADSVCAAMIRKGFSDFRKQYPQISVLIPTAGTNELFRLLDQNEVDLVCTLDSRIYNTNYVVASEEKVAAHFVVSAGHPLAERETVFLNEILEQPLILTEKGVSYRRLLEEHLAREQIDLEPVLEIGNTYLLCELVEKGVGVSLLPDFVTEEAVRRGTVVRLRVPEFEPELWKQLLYHRDKWVSQQMEIVMHHLGNLLLERAE